MTYPLLLLVLSFASPSPDEVTVYFGANAARSLPITEGNLGLPFDIAYDKAANKLFCLTKLADGFHCLRLSLDGRKEADWRLSDSRRPICELHRSQGQLRTILWKENGSGTGPILFASVPEGPSDAVKVEETKDWLEYDRALAPARVKPIHKLMVMLEFYPPMREAGGRPQNLDWVEVNARSLYTHMAWTPDYSVISYTWDMIIKTAVAIRKANGNYRVEDMQRPIKRALGIAEGGYVTIDVQTVTVTDRIAAYGLSIRGRGRPSVLAFDITVSPPKLLWKKPGYLARDLERY